MGDFFGGHCTCRCPLTCEVTYEPDDVLVDVTLALEVTYEPDNVLVYAPLRCDEPDDVLVGSVACST